MVVDGFVSLNFFVVVCILVGGLLIIILSFTLDSMIFRCVCRKGEHTRYSRLEWSTHDTLQIRPPAVDGHHGLDGERSDDTPLEEDGEILNGLKLMVEDIRGKEDV